MAYPPVTVLIPAYNAARTIERALASVWRQDYPETEVIVVDDGSTDDTRGRVEKIGGHNLRLIRLEQNCGVSAAMNVGIQQARTDYIAFLDADDEWLENKLSSQLPIIESHPEMSLIFCEWQLVERDGRVCRPRGFDLPACSAGEFWRALLVKSYIAKPTVVARRSKLLEAGGFDEALKIGEDQDMWIKLALIGKVGVVHQVFVCVHETSGSLMKRYGTREDEFGLPMIRNHLDRLTSRLSKQEIRQILGQRYAATGRSLYAFGTAWRGAALVIRAMLLGNRPLYNLAYLISAAPVTTPLKRFLLRRRLITGIEPARKINGQG